MSTMNFRQRIALADFLAKHFAATRKNDLNPEALGEMTAGERLAARFGGRVAAWVSLPHPAMRASVEDEAAFLAWVKKHKPSEVETVEIVRPGSRRALLDAAKARDGMWLDARTGELIRMDGVKVETGDPAVRVELEDDAADIIGEAWRDGSIDVGSLLALAPAEDAAQRIAYPASDPLYMDEHGFFDPERAAHHAIVVQGGYSTPPIEAYRMIADGGVGAARARAWLQQHGLDPDDPQRGKNTPWPLPAGGGDD